jgi:hypothetical protein
MHPGYEGSYKIRSNLLETILSPISIASRFTYYLIIAVQIKIIFTKSGISDTFDTAFA